VYLGHRFRMVEKQPNFLWGYFKTVYMRQNLLT